MKKLLLATIILIQASRVSAQESVNQELASIYVRQDNVKVYKQPNASGEVIQVLKLDDHVELLRKFNDKWMIVKVNGQPGYIERWHLTKKKNRQKI